MLTTKFLILVSLSFAVITVSGVFQSVSDQISEPRLAVAVLDFGGTPTGRLASQKLAENLKSYRNISVQDHDQAHAASRGESRASASPERVSVRK